jgi:SsrA-binding protein
MARKAATNRYHEVRNAKAHRDYFVDETVECGVVLTGTEVKSIRQGKVQLSDAFVRIERGTPTLYHCHIAEYGFGGHDNHAVYRPRRLLLHKREIRNWEQQMQSGGMTIVPLKLYFKKGLVKMQIGLCRGKKNYDKRDDLKEKADLREVQRTVHFHL